VGLSGANSMLLQQGVVIKASRAARTNGVKYLTQQGIAKRAIAKRRVICFVAWDVGGGG
jgi:hypothetical protein